MKAFEVQFTALGLSFQRRKDPLREEAPYFFALLGSFYCFVRLIVVGRLKHPGWMPRHAVFMEKDEGRH